MSLKEQIADAERMQRWGYADQLRAQLANLPHDAPEAQEAAEPEATETPDEEN